MKIELNCWSCLSLVVFTANLISDWYVYHCEVNPPVPSHLADWWFWLSVVGTGISAIVLCLDLCCCAWCIALEIKEDDDDCDDDRVIVSHSVFLATLFEDLPLLSMSLVIMNNMTLSSDGTAGVADLDLLSALTYSSMASLAVSVFRLVKVLTLDFKHYNECTSYFKCCLCFLYIAVSILSYVVIFTVMSNLHKFSLSCVESCRTYTYKPW